MMENEIKINTALRIAYLVTLLSRNQQERDKETKTCQVVIENANIFILITEY